MSISMFSAPSRLALLITGCIALSSTWVSAQTAVPAPLSQSLEGDARSAYASARLLFDDGDYSGALTKFKHAYDLSKDPRLLWNMAVCEKELRHYARTASLVSLYLKEGGALISAEQRRSATETRTALHAFYSAVELSGAPDGARVFVDGSPAGQAPLAEPLLLDLGVHRVRIESPGFEPFETSIDVAGNTPMRVPVRLTAGAARVALPRLSVTSSGEQDLVTVDGKVMGSRHWEGAVTVGEHTVRVSAPHKRAYLARMELALGSSRSLDVTLEDEARHSTVWYWVAGGATLAAGAIVGGYFLFKPKEEPGAHPSGALATIFLPPAAWGSIGGQR